MGLSEVTSRIEHMSEGVVTTAELARVERARACAEAETYMAMLAFADGEHARIDALESPMRRLVEKAGIPLEIGQAMGLSEGQVMTRMAAARRVRELAPRVWQAFGLGLVDAARLRDISQTIDRLHRPESVERLDARVLSYADGHTAAELRQWLRRFVERVEPDESVERAETARADRRVEVNHGEDGMSWLNAYLPSHQVAAIEHRLRLLARRPDAGDTRTVSQREADRLAAWCMTADAGVVSVDAHIAVVIDADVLAGATPGFAVSADGRWSVPAAWIVALATNGNAFWHRMVVDPVTDDVLSHHYLGRFAPDVLDQALAFRDGVCRAPGCLVPADRCDIDHLVAWPEGPTRGDNLGPLCRRHHGLKGHGVLRWSIGSPQPPPPSSVLELHLRHLTVEYAA